MHPLYGEDLVKELRRHSDNVFKRLWIAVPYIGSLQTIRRVLGRNWMENPKLSIRLLTDINELSNFNSETIEVFNKLGNIRHIAGLHAKIYITDKTSLITSANLTNTAFSKRHEIGIFLDGTNSSEVVSIFESWWRKSEAVSPKTLKTLRKKRYISSEEGNGSTVLQNQWSLPEDPGEMNYWLKPIGVTDDPITEERVFTDIEERLHFSKLKPQGVKIGDILIAYGVGARRILSIYKVISEPMPDKNNDRWPWYVIGLNLTPRFGKKWTLYNVYADDIRNEYLQMIPKKEKKITKVGGITFGGLNFGKDKLKLNPEFAEFIIRRVMEFNSTH